MSKGILLFAQNNHEIDYTRLAVIAARLATTHLSVPISLFTDPGSIAWANNNYKHDLKIFDNIIIPDDKVEFYQDRKFYDGALSYKKANFNNLTRGFAYDYTPYDQTLVIDTDLLINNSSLNSIWDSTESFLINSDHRDISTERDSFEFERLNDSGIKFYWATAFYFKKNKWTKVFFDLCKHIASEYDYYRFVYRIDHALLRNDYVFSIALHIMNGFEDAIIPSLPTKIHYCLDRDVLWDVTDKNEYLFLIQKPEHLGEYSLVKTKNQTVHIMNKYSILRNEDKILRSI
jgi:hypothetical protein